MMYMLLSLAYGETEMGCPEYLFTSKEKAEEFLDARVDESKRRCYAIIEMRVDPDPWPCGPELRLYSVHLYRNGVAEADVVPHSLQAVPDEWIDKGNGTELEWFCHVMAASPELAIAVARERTAAESPKTFAGPVANMKAGDCIVIPGEVQIMSVPKMSPGVSLSYRVVEHGQEMPLDPGMMGHGHPMGFGRQHELVIRASQDGTIELELGR